MTRLLSRQRLEAAPVVKVRKDRICFALGKAILHNTCCWLIFICRVSSLCKTTVVVQSKSLSFTPVYVHCYHPEARFQLENLTKKMKNTAGFFHHCSQADKVVEPSIPLTLIIMNFFINKSLPIRVNCITSQRHVIIQLL